MINNRPVDQVTADDVLREVDVVPTPFTAAAAGYTLAILSVLAWVLWPVSVHVAGSLTGGTFTTLLVSVAGGCLWAYQGKRSSESVAGRERRARDLARRVVDREAVRLGLTMRTADSFLDGSRATIGHTAAWRYCEQVRAGAREAAVRAEACRRVAHQTQFAIEAERSADFDSRVERTVTKLREKGHVPASPDSSTGGRP